MKHITRVAKGEGQRNMIRLFDSICGSRNRWQVWSDMVYMIAASISNAVDRKHFESREKQYLATVKNYNAKQMECFAQLFAEIVMELERQPEQDLLGELFMALELGNAHNGQFFTPYDVCRCMASMTNDNLKARIERDHWISVNDPACGAGALLVAFANECRRPGVDVNYQTSVLFVAQDIDMIAGLMCYIQLSILGCPGYVVIANTLTNPSTSYDRRGLIPRDSENVWYTPFYFREEWHWRRMAAQMDMLISLPANSDTPPAEPEETPAPVLPAQEVSKPEPVADPEPEPKSDKFGQLTLF